MSVKKRQVSESEPSKSVTYLVNEFLWSSEERIQKDFRCKNLESEGFFFFNHRYHHPILMNPLPK